MTALAADVVGHAVITIGADTSQFDAQLAKGTDKAAKKSGKSFSSTLGSTLLAGGKIAGAGLAGVLGAALVKGFGRLTAIDDAKGKLKGLGYTAKQITTIMTSALTSVKGTAFGLGDAASQAANLVSSGIKPGKELTRTLKLLADTSSIAGTDLSSMGRVFQKVAATGKLTGDALQQLTDAGIPVVAFLSKSLHKSMGDVSKDISAGKISFNEFQTAMEQGLGGAALASGNTFTGAMKNVAAALGRFGAAVLGGVFAKLPGLFAQMITWLDAITPAAARVGAALGAQFANVGPILKEIVGSIRAFVISFIIADHDITSSGMPGFFEEVGYWARQVWNVFVNQLVPAAVAVVKSGMAVIGYLREHTTQAGILVGVVGTLVAVEKIHAAVLAYQASTGLVAYIKSIQVVQYATKVWAAVQWVLNAALAANPITLLVIGLVALGAALFIAYKKSEMFRDIINGAWTAIKTVAMAVVGWIVNTAVPWIIGAWNAIVGGVLKMRDAVIGAWNTVWNTLKAVGSWINTTFGPLFWTFEKTIEFVFKAIEILILAWYKLVIFPVFNAVTGALTALGAKFNNFLHAVITPVVNAVSAAITFMWKKGIQPVFTAITNGITQLAARFSKFWHNDIVPIWNGIGSAISTAWHKGIDPVFSAIKTGIGKVKSAFDTSVAGIRGAWNKLEGITKIPIKFVIQTVLNNGLIKAFNWLGSKVGGPHIDNIPLPFATGGVTPGYTPGRDVHQFYSPTGGSLALSGGEAIMVPEFTRAMGGKPGIDRLNKLARNGMLSGDFHTGGVVHKYGLGGIVDWIKHQASNAFDWVGDKASSTYQAVTNPLKYLKSKMGSIPGAGVVRQYAGAAAQKLAGSAAGKAKSMWNDFSKAFQSTGGPVFAKMKAWVMSHLGIPYLWGGNGPRYDCSSFTQHAAAAAGIGIPRTAAAQQAFARAVSGGALKPGDLGFNGRPAHHVMLNMGQGMWAEEPHTGDVSKIIRAGRGAAFTSYGRIFDNGGTLGKGLNLVRNNTGSPEHLVPAGSGDTIINVTISVDDLARMKTVEDFVDMLKNSRATTRKTRRSGTVTL